MKNQDKNQIESVGLVVLALDDFLGHLIDLNSFHAAQKTIAQIITYQKLHSDA